MRNILWLLFLLVLLPGCSSEHKEKPWSYIDRTGRLITKDSFQSADSFSEGLGNVSIDGKHGYIDKAGQFVIKPQFKFAGSFNEGLAPAGHSEIQGFINHAGQYVISPRFGWAQGFSEGLALVKEQETGQIGFIDRSGKFIIKLPKGFSAHSFQEGFAAIINLRHFDKEHGYKRKYGYIDKTGRIAIPANFEIGDSSIYPFHEGFAPVEINGRIGFIDKTGKMVIAPKYFKVEGQGFSNGLALVRTQKKLELESKNNLVFINKKGEIAINPGTSLIGPFSEGLAPILTDKTGWGYINTSGKVVIKPQFDCAMEFSGGLANVCTRGGPSHFQNTGFINKAGKLVIPPQYWDASAFLDNIAVVCLDDSDFQCSSP